jgi:hypothetical protein
MYVFLGVVPFWPVLELLGGAQAGKKNKLAAVRKRRDCAHNFRRRRPAAARTIANSASPE